MAGHFRTAGGPPGDQGEYPQADEAGDGEQRPQVAQTGSGKKAVGGEGQQDHHVDQADPGQGPFHRGGGGVVRLPAVLLGGALFLRHLLLLL